jgi:RNA recognition motif-containing protein
MNIYVCNLSYKVGADSLTKAFSTYGRVSSVNIIVDKVTDQSRGFAFIEMPDQHAAEIAIRELDGTMLEGRFMKTSVAAEKLQRAKRNSFY